MARGGHIITVSIDSPVKYVAQGSGATIDEAAKHVIDELEIVHAWEDGKPKSPFSFVSTGHPARKADELA
jgi:hypothetical protein